MLINELAKHTGVTIHTLRYYENLGLIQGSVDESVTSNNYKKYDEEVVERVEFIKVGKEAGFTLAEIKKMLDKCFSGSFTMEEQLQYVDNKIAEMDTKIQNLQQAKVRLLELRKDIEEGIC
jgi:DNA-binding transcriptional MerR regulator